MDAKALGEEVLQEGALVALALELEGRGARRGGAPVSRELIAELFRGQGYGGGMAGRERMGRRVTCCTPAVVGNSRPGHRWNSVPTVRDHQSLARARVMRDLAAAAALDVEKLRLADGAPGGFYAVTEVSMATRSA